MLLGRSFHQWLFDDGGYRIEVKVVSQKGTCEFCHQVGDVVTFDGETIQGRICLSALYSFMPKVYFKFENLVLWARSEIIGSACNSFKE
jgi:uncharacterized repeat protein (TIGR04076 family)